MTVTDSEATAALPSTLSILLLEDNVLDAELTCASLGFRESDCTIKRVDNRRMREQLSVSLAYPSYSEGLKAILADELMPGAP